MKKEDVSLWDEDFLKKIVRHSGIHFRIKTMQFRLRIEPNWRDMWVGWFIKTKDPCTKLYVCLLPMLPITLQWWRMREIK
jgi:hypothetical protein